MARAMSETPLEASGWTAIPLKRRGGRMSSKFETCNGYTMGGQSKRIKELQYMHDTITLYAAMLPCRHHMSNHVLSYVFVCC